MLVNRSQAALHHKTSVNLAVEQRQMSGLKLRCSGPARGKYMENPAGSSALSRKGLSIEAQSSQRASLPQMKLLKNVLDVLGLTARHPLGGTALFHPGEEGSMLRGFQGLERSSQVSKGLRP